MGLFSKKKTAKKGVKLPKTVQESIPYTRIYDNGVIETSPGTFTKSYRLEDMNFKVAADSVQISLYQRYEMLLNSFAPTTHFQILIQNHMTDKRTSINDIRFMPQRDGLNRHRSAMNELLLDKMGEGKNSLTQNKYLIVSVEDDSVNHAMQVLGAIDTDVDKAIRAINRDIQTPPMTIEERLRVLHGFYNQDNESVFENTKSRTGTPKFSLDQVYASGITSKDVIGPSGMEFRPNYFRLGNCYGRALYLESVSNWLSTDFLADLSNLQQSQAISIYYEPIETSQAMKLVKNHLLNINAQLTAEQKRAANDGLPGELYSAETIRSREQAEDLLQEMVGRDQKLFYAAMTVCVFAESKTELEEATRLVTTVANNYMCPIKTLIFQQEYGLNAALPLCQYDLFTKRLYTSESGAVFMPYNSQELFQKDGVFYGLNQTTNSMILYDRRSGKNYNGLIFGESGAGKSFIAKCEMFSLLLRSDKNRIYIIDPEREYCDMVTLLGGEVIDLSPGSKTFVNPLDMDLDYSGDKDPVSMKSDYIFSMIEIMLGPGRALDPKAKSIVDRCVKNIYRGYLKHLDSVREHHPEITCDREAMPTLSNLYNELLLQPEPEAHTVAGILEIYATGSLATFAHRSNVETDKRIVVYDISKLGSGMKELGLHICLNDVWNVMIENRKKDLWTYFYIDEFHLLLQSDSAASFLVQIWKRARKWNGIPTGIMQNTEDLLRSADSRNIINNSSFIIMMSLQQIDRSNLGDLLNIPEGLLHYITNGQPGQGLIYNGKTIIPFNHTIDPDKNADLYDIMSSSQSKDKLDFRN